MTLANKVEIIVVAKDMTGPVFDSIEKKAKDSGDKAGKSFGDGFSNGMQNSVKNVNTSQLTTAFSNAGRQAGASFSAGLNSGISGSGGGNNNSPLRSRSQSWIADAAAVGKEMGSVLMQGVGAAFSAGQSGALTTGLWAGLIASAVVASPLLAAALAGAIAGTGVLATAVGGAIIAAVNSPEIQAAGAQLGDNLMSALNGPSQAFVQPMLTAIDMIEAKVQSAGPLLTSLFENAAEAIVPLTDAILDATEEIAGGLNSMFESSGPELIAELDTGIRLLGDSLGYMFEQFGESEGVADGLGTIFAVISGGVVVATDALTFLADRYHEVIELIREFDQAIDPQEGKWVQIKDATDQAAEATKRWATAIAEAKPTAEELITFGGDMTSSMSAYEKAVDSVASKQEKFNEAVKQYGADSPEAALAGAQLADAIQKQADAAQQAVGAYEGWTPAMQAWAEAAGLSASEIDALKASLDAGIASAQAFAVEWVATFIADTADANAKSEEARAKAQAFAKQWNAQITADNADALAKTAAAQAAVQAVAKEWKARVTVENQQAMSAIGAVVNGLASIQSKTVTVTVNAQGAGLALGLRSGGVAGAANVGKAASGGVRGNFTLVGEEGPELVKLPFGSTVLPYGQTRSILSEEDRSIGRAREMAMSGGSQAADNTELISEIRRLGDRMERMQIVIDDRVLGSVQGRQADLYYRAN